VHVKSLKVFCDVVAFRSFSRAADENGVSQSNASQIVHQLEEELGVKLIDRSKRPLVLTPAGEVYYSGCRKLVQRFLALEEEVRSLRREVSGRVRVASIYSVGLSYLSRKVQEFTSRHPEANVRIEYQHPKRVYELVENDAVDLGLVSYPKSSRSLKAIPWREEPMAVVCAPSHPLAGRTSVRVEELDEAPLVAFDGELTIRREIDRALDGRRVSPKVVMEFDNIETIKRAIEIEAGLGILPTPTVAREVQWGSLVAIPFENIELIRPLGVIHRRHKQLGNTARRFVRHLLADRRKFSGEGSGIDRPADTPSGAAPLREAAAALESGADSAPAPL
jgi:DNA-binding transcriptional LysR family regulator